MKNQHAAAVGRNVVAFIEMPPAAAAACLFNKGRQCGFSRWAQTEEHLFSTNRVVSVHTRKFIQIGTMY